MSRGALSAVVNAAIFITTLALLLRLFRQDDKWQFRRGLPAFRFFTVLSNAFCALSALAMAVCQVRGSVPPAVLTLKYLGTVSVTVTLLTVFAFLGPTQGGYRELLKGDNLYMHLIGPLLAILSFCLLEKGSMSLGAALLGLVPVVLYGALYLRKVVYAPEGSRWEDFYGFNRNGRWPVAFAAMVIGTALICLAFWLVPGRIL